MTFKIVSLFKCHVFETLSCFSTCGWEFHNWLRILLQCTGVKCYIFYLFVIHTFDILLYHAEWISMNHKHCETGYHWHFTEFWHLFKFQRFLSKCCIEMLIDDLSPVSHALSHFTAFSIAQPKNNWQGLNWDGIEVITVNRLAM